MIDEATQQGASVHERLMTLLGGEEAPIQPEQKPAPVVEEEEAEETAQSAPEPEERAEEEETEKDAQEADESRTIELSDVAKYLGVDADLLDVDEDGSISIKTKVDGQEGRAKLKDLHKSYQLEGHLNKQNMEVAEKRKALEAKMAEVEQQAQQRFQQAEDLISIAQQDLLGEYNAVDWQALRRDDPGEFSAKMADFKNRHERLNYSLSQIQQDRQKRSQEAMQQRIREESEKLLSAIPEWRNEETRKKDQAALREYGIKAGFADEELASVADHRAVNLLRKAMLYDQLMSKKTEVEKKVKAAPKIAKPGQPASKQERQDSDQKKLRQAIRKSGGKHGIREYLLATNKV